MCVFLCAPVGYIKKVGVWGFKTSLWSSLWNHNYIHTTLSITLIFNFSISSSLCMCLITRTFRADQILYLSINAWEVLLSCILLTGWRFRCVVFKWHLIWENMIKSSYDYWYAWSYACVCKRKCFKNILDICCHEKWQQSWKTIWR